MQSKICQSCPHCINIYLVPFTACQVLPTCALRSPSSSFAVLHKHGAPVSVVITHRAIEAMLPELTKPRVARVRVRIEAEVIVVEIRDVGRVDAD